MGIATLHRLFPLHASTAGQQQDIQEIFRMRGVRDPQKIAEAISAIQNANAILGTDFELSLKMLANETYAVEPRIQKLLPKIGANITAYNETLLRRHVFDGDADGREERLTFAEERAAEIADALDAMYEATPDIKAQRLALSASKAYASGQTRSAHDIDHESLWFECRKATAIAEKLAQIWAQGPEAAPAVFARLTAGQRQAASSVPSAM